MSQDNYREKIEEHRQSIEIEETNSRTTRSRRKIKKNKKRKNPLMTILLVVLLGIPSAFLFYVSFIYSPEGKEVAKADKGGSVVELQKNDTVSSSGKEDVKPVIEDDQEEENTQPTTDQNQQEKSAEENQKELEKQQELEKQKELEQKENQKVHTVKPNETLYRIAMTYYNDPSGVDKIKAANNLRSDSISVGQDLIIP